MIQLTRLNSKPIFINSDLVELIDEAPDTIITLTTGRKILVAETAHRVIERIIEFRRRCRGYGFPGQTGVEAADAASDAAPAVTGGSSPNGGRANASRKCQESEDSL